MGQIVVFSKSKCPHCSEAKALLGDLSIPFTDIVVTQLLLSRDTYMPELTYSQIRVKKNNATPIKA
jgi:glutaredoxin